MQLMIQLLFKEPHTYFGLVLALVISIVIHELAHGWVAIKLGDRTPITSGHMTLNPVVHLGWFSIFWLLIVGLAWGQMPYNPSNLRGRYGVAWVALAGPAVNLLIAFITLTGVAVLTNHPLQLSDEMSHIQENLLKLLFFLGLYNVILAGFNMLPVPPLDGSAALATFHRGYGDAVANPNNQQLWFGAMIALFIFSPYIGGFLVTAAQAFVAIMVQFV